MKVTNKLLACGLALFAGHALADVQGNPTGDQATTPVNEVFDHYLEVECSAALVEISTQETRTIGGNPFTGYWLEHDAGTGIGGQEGTPGASYSMLAAERLTVDLQASCPVILGYKCEPIDALGLVATSPAQSASANGCDFRRAAKNDGSAFSPALSEQYVMPATVSLERSSGGAAAQQFSQDNTTPAADREYKLNVSASIPGAGVEAAIYKLPIKLTVITQP